LKAACRLWAGSRHRAAGSVRSALGQKRTSGAVQTDVRFAATADIAAKPLRSALGHLQTHALQQSPLMGIIASRPAVLAFIAGMNMPHWHFDDVEIGTIRKAGPYLVSKEEIIRFAKQYDPLPIHFDEEAAAHSIFGGLIASGSHTFAIFTSLSRKLQPQLNVLAGLGWDELRVPSPVRPGDELVLEVIVLEKRDSKSKPDRGIVRFQIRLRNQRNEIVLQCISNALVARRPSP
jgi:acyl dehydratase